MLILMLGACRDLSAAIAASSNKALKLTANPLRLRLAVVGSLALTLSLSKKYGKLTFSSKIIVK